MERTKFEPFGERLADREASSRSSERVSRSMLWAGSAVFWTIVAVVVVARATYFDPAVFNFNRLAAIVLNLI
jgi:hypothetical protein